MLNASHMMVRSKYMLISVQSIYRTEFTGEMDYKTYLDFVLALENRQEPQSLQYLFRILDLDHQGYLTSFTLNYFFKVRQLKHNLLINL